MYHNFFIHSSVDGHLGCFHVLAIVNSAAMNNGMHVSLSILISSRYMPRSWIAGLYGGFNPNVLRNLHTGIHQFSSVAQLCLTLCDPMDCSTPSLPVHHQLLVFTQTRIHWVSDAIQPPHPLSWSPCSPRDSQKSSPTPQFKSINSSSLSFLYSPTLTSIHDCWKNHSFD